MATQIRNTSGQDVSPRDSTQRAKKTHGKIPKVRDVSQAGQGDRRQRVPGPPANYQGDRADRPHRARPGNPGPAISTAQEDPAIAAHATDSDRKGNQKDGPKNKRRSNKTKVINPQEERAIEFTGGSAANLTEALDQWENEREVLAQLYDDNQAYNILNRRLRLALDAARDIVDRTEQDAAMFVTKKTRDQIELFRAQYNKLVDTNQLSNIINDGKKRKE